MELDNFTQVSTQISKDMRWFPLLWGARLENTVDSRITRRSINSRRGRDSGSGTLRDRNSMRPGKNISTQFPHDFHTPRGVFACRIDDRAPGNDVEYRYVAQLGLAASEARFECVTNDGSRNRYIILLFTVAIPVVIKHIIQEFN